MACRARLTLRRQRPSPVTCSSPPPRVHANVVWHQAMVNGELKEEFAVLDVQPLHPRRPDGEAAAVALLKQAAWQVQPIMKRRRWKVHVLRELEPENMTRGACGAVSGCRAERLKA